MKFETAIHRFSLSQVPVNDQVVTITKPVLLDTATARLGGVEIRDGGRLVFSPAAAASQPVALTARLLEFSYDDIQGDYVGFNTGNGEKPSYSQAAGLAWLAWL